MYRVDYTCTACGDKFALWQLEPEPDPAILTCLACIDAEVIRQSGRSASRAQR